MTVNIFLEIQFYIQSSLQNQDSFSMQDKKCQLVYLISRYPAYSHTFIQREIEGLRQKGFIIHTASINRPDIPASAFTASDQKEYHNTFYIKSQSLLHILFVILLSLCKRPLKFFLGVGYALSLGKYDLKQCLYHVFYFVEALIVGHWMEAKQVSHLHVHFANPSASVALIASRIFPIKFSLTVHGPDEFYDVSFHHLLEKFAHAEFILCISNYARSQILRLLPPSHWNKCQIAYLGVDVEKYHSSGPINKEPKAKKPLRILCVGRLCANKGQRILFEAIKPLIAENLDLNLTFIGEGPDRADLEKQVQACGLNTHIRFTGALNADAVLDYYRQTDLFVLTSFAEGLPVVLMEAMAFEIPCIATAINGIPELITHEKNGLLVFASDVLQLSQALRKLNHDPALRDTLGKQARLTITEKFNFSVNIDHLANLLSSNLLERN